MQRLDFRIFPQCTIVYVLPTIAFSTILVLFQIQISSSLLQDSIQIILTI